MEKEEAIFAAGCFWGVESALRATDGVLDVEVGYTGGHSENPTYEEVCRGRTGHAEAARVVYDPARISFQGLVRRFFEIHDPTTLNRQGPDVGEQYRSAIFYLTPLQREEAALVLQQESESGRHKGAIVTELVPAGKFYPAEEYHQRYLEKRGGGTCHI